MDGFFVAKFKVEKRKPKKAGAAQDDADAEDNEQVAAGGDGEGSSAVFNDPADAAIIDGESECHHHSFKADITEGKRKNLLKTKGIKVAPKAAPVASKPAPAKDDGQMKMPKGKKLTEKRRQK